MTTSAQVDSPILVILVRHAQSQWNLENRFSGWADPPLTPAGAEEAIAAGEHLRRLGYRFDIAFTSRLSRAKTTLEILLRQMSHPPIPIKEDWRLNERHYGALEGRIKTPEANNTTPEQVWRWRRSYLEKAEPLSLDDPRHPRLSPLYKDLDTALLPAVENLADTRLRVMALWDEEILPDAMSGQRPIVSAHGNTLRALLMGVADMSVEQIESFEIPTGIPMQVQLDERGKFQSWKYLVPKI